MIYLLPSLMLLMLMMGILSGYPVALLLGGLAIVFTFVGDLPLAGFGLIVSRIYGGVLSNWILAAIPLFVFMGIMLDKSDIAKKILQELEALFAGKSGGLALSVIVIGIVMAASTGIVGASVVLMGTLALPVMLKQGYDKSLAMGTILGSGTLGILIPPSIMLVVFGDILQVSIGGLFAAALIPGAMLGLLYALYVIITAIVSPEKAPARRGEETAGLVPLLLRLATNLVIPALLITSVLGSIITGVATPTEGAAIGAAGALLLTLLSGKLSWSVLSGACKETTLTTGMILFLSIGATAYGVVFSRLGGSDMIYALVGLLGGEPYVILMGAMLLIFVLGFFLEWIEISFLVLPLLAPVIGQLDFAPAIDSSHDVLIWFAVLVAVNLQTSFLTPPFGYALFYLKGIAPKGISTVDIYRSVKPFVLIQLAGLVLIILFPAIALWLPGIL
ncbi:TRAP transporter large permease subunit [Marinobacter sp. M3C]|uniref:TRAP transporter large permease n=1 Tax=unclassified Marinobacter TaxID=83889 RepID=UPI00200C38A3|nr:MULTISPECIES: TRAP transporter large permease subunit [unclassified Marinobacter]MCL1476226.1 TRAP transporter large permease subunit [Marinobacter sp.]MCL1482981.1 TRAP transporter large permease subunit [Marinobacter sp.]MCL1488795.1 TRAP transporter large permease subunit [Marinobacter sp.]UQG58122.1 TRAP transporter large permease subunit [Marinobacter sp. M4C]UQG60580.1 TRAP transporter large permease subunit [Marinobacter sp. M3C]